MGIAEQGKGLIKEAAGKITGKDNLEAEGEAQFEKGREESTATAKRAEAQAHEAKADAAQAKQDAAENS